MMMNKFNPKKLLNSKWSAVTVKNKEKHFIVTKVEFNEDDEITHCIIEAIYSNNNYTINWEHLKDSNIWILGWQ